MADGIDRSRTIASVVLISALVIGIGWWITRSGRRHALGLGKSTPVANGSASTAATPGETPAPAGPLRVPRTNEAITLDGELGEEPWHDPARTGPFRTAGGSSEPARPYSDARFLRDATHLYLGLYAADQDERSGTDAFRLAFVSPKDGSILTLSISVDKKVLEKRIVNGTEAPGWKSGIEIGVDSDGTLDDPSDEDEEWVVEAKIPIASLGLDPATGGEIRASFARCDIPKDGIERCGDWGVGPDGGIAGILKL